MKPIIGIPLRYDKDRETDLSVIYIYETMRRSVQKLGGDVMPISPVVDVDCMDTKLSEFPEITDANIKSLNRFLDMCDGLILPGGTKFLPTDRYILDYAIRKDIPILGICLSMQMMSCYKEDIQLEKNSDSGMNHNQSRTETYKHKVKILKNSLLYKIIGKEEIEVNSFHNYHVTENHLYNTVAYSEDGLIEAIEYPSNTFNIGVQWHPERMVDYDDSSYKLMTYFIDEAIKYCEEKVKKENQKKVESL